MNTHALTERSDDGETDDPDAFTVRDAGALDAASQGETHAFDAPIDGRTTCSGLLTDKGTLIRRRHRRHAYNSDGVNCARGWHDLRTGWRGSPVEFADPSANIA